MKKDVHSFCIRCTMRYPWVPNINLPFCLIIYFIFRAVPQGTKNCKIILKQGMWEWILLVKHLSMSEPVATQIAGAFTRWCCKSCGTPGYSGTLRCCLLHQLLKCIFETYFALGWENNGFSVKHSITWRPLEYERVYRYTLSYSRGRCIHFKPS